jgi:ubiquitin C-terminal hydrolase
MANNKSIISDLFYRINCNITQCGGCGIQTFNYQTYFFIVFPLEEVRKFKQNNQNNNFTPFNQFQFNPFTFNNNYNANEVSIFYPSIYND